MWTSNQGIVMSPVSDHLFWFRARGTKCCLRWSSRSGSVETHEVSTPRKGILGIGHNTYRGTEVGK